MKKLLALVLALVMTLGLATVSAGATTFTDDADIDHQEAVEVMNTLNIINGMGDGKFDPNGNVTRAQMAKMVTIALLGDVEVSAFTGTATDLKDVGGHWAEGYIKYCYSQGIISGRGNGIFDPNANVTTAEASKMLLVALGYNSDVRKYTGDQWAINVARDAQMKGLYDDISNLTSNKAMDRDDAAQMIYNTLNATRVEEKQSINSDGTVTLNYQDATAYPTNLLAKTFGASSVDTVLTGTTLQTTGANKGTYTLTTTTAGTPVKSAKDYSELLGQTVTVIFEDKDKDGNYDAGESVIGVYAKYENAATDLIAQSAVEKSSDKKVKANGTTYEFDNAAPTLYTVTTASGVATTVGTTTTAALESAASFNQVRFVDTDESGKYDLVVLYTVASEKLTYADSSKVIGTNTYKADDCIIESGLKKDNYVAISWNFAESKTELKNIEKLTGKVTATKTNKAKVDGGEWLYDAGNTMTVDDTYDYYVLNGVLVDATKTTATAVENFVFVSGVETTISGTQARIWRTDGTGATVTVDTTNTVTEAGDDGDTPVIPTADRFYTISETSKGYKFTAAKAGTKSAMLKDYTFVAGTTNDVDVTGTIDTINGVGINDDAVIFVYNHKQGNSAANISGGNFDVKVITGKQLKTLTAVTSRFAGKIHADSAGFLTKTTNGLAKVGYAAVQYVSSTNAVWAGWSVGATSDNYAIVVDAAVSISNGTQYTVWTGSETVTVTDTDKKITPAKFDLVLYDSIDDGAIKGATLMDVKHDVYTTSDTTFQPIAITAFEKITNGYNLYANVAKDKIVTNSDTKWIYINSGADKAEDIGLAEAVDLSTARTVYDQNVQNAIVYCSVAGTADVVVIDATNELVKAAATQVVLTLTNNSSSDGTFVVKNADGDVVASGDTFKAGDLLTVEVTTSASKTVTSVSAGDIADTTGTKYEVLSTAAAGTYSLVVFDDVTTASITKNS